MVDTDIRTMVFRANGAGKTMLCALGMTERVHSFNPERIIVVGNPCPETLQALQVLKGYGKQTDVLHALSWEDESRYIASQNAMVVRAP